MRRIRDTSPSGMEGLLNSIENLKRSGMKKLIDKRIREFRTLGKSSEEEIFQELCFCLLTANYSAEGGIRIQKEVVDGFCSFPEETLKTRLRELGHRHPNTRTGYILGARRHIEELKALLSKSGPDAREWLVRNIKGLGMKEASHFLRNTGFLDLAIIDFHITDLLVREGLIERPKTLTKKRYLDIEGILRKLAEKSGLTLAELDLYLWYLETGKVLK